MGLKKEITIFSPPERLWFDQTAVIHGNSLPD
jgi:hypothetical protein